MRTADGSVITSGRPTFEQPRAIILVFEGDSGTDTYVARCPCGWNAAASATDAQTAKANLHALVNAHRRRCERFTSES